MFEVRGRESATRLLRLNDDSAQVSFHSESYKKVSWQKGHTHTVTAVQMIFMFIIIYLSWSTSSEFSSLLKSGDYITHNATWTPKAQLEIQAWHRFCFFCFFKGLHRTWLQLVYHNVIFCFIINQLFLQSINLLKFFCLSKFSDLISLNG